MSSLPVNYVTNRYLSEVHYDRFDIGGIHLMRGDVADFYEEWPSPTVIISDGPYGIGGFPGDPYSPQQLGQWYEPHIAQWAKHSSPITTLWFWNTEVGWATVHPFLIRHGWEYVSCCIWDKGMGHVAGNVNTKTIRRLPVVTEICAQYVKKAMFLVNGREASMKEWLRAEWARTELPFSKTNEVCGVIDAATRKYFTKCHLWYMPPADAFEKLSLYANEHGAPAGRPYFSIDGKKPLSANEWEKMRSKFYCPMGVTNVWHESQLRGKERLKSNQKAIHLNQKPLSIIKRTIEMTSDTKDVVWDPFAGLCTVAVASVQLDRECWSAEISPETFSIGVKRVQSELNDCTQRLL